MYNPDYAQHGELSQRHKSGSNWFYWIAGLSLITSFIHLTGGTWGFLISLGTTQVISGIAEGLSEALGSATKVIGLVLNIFITGVFVLFGVLAGKKYLWAYVLGMVLFLFDGLVSVAFQDWLGVGAHVVVLMFMVPGFQAGRKLVEIEQAMAQQPPEPAPQTTPSF